MERLACSAHPAVKPKSCHDEVTHLGSGMASFFGLLVCPKFFLSQDQCSQDPSLLPLVPKLLDVDAVSHVFGRKP